MILSETVRSDRRTKRCQRGDRMCRLCRCLWRRGGMRPTQQGQGPTRRRCDVHQDRL